MAKYYFKNDSWDEERCYQKSHFLDEMKEEGIKEMEIFEAVLCKNSGFFYCSEYGEVGDSNDSDCGKECKLYEPRNHVSGRCRFSKSTYTAGKSIILKIK